MCLKQSSICISFCSEGLWPHTDSSLDLCSARVWRSEQMGVSVCGPALRLSLRVLHTHTAMPLIALFCPFSISNLFLIIPHNMSSRVLCVSLCTWTREFLSLCVGRWLFVFLYVMCTSECVNLFLLNTQDGSQQSANQLVVPQLIFEVDELI